MSVRSGTGSSFAVGQVIEFEVMEVLEKSDKIYKFPTGPFGSF